MIIWIISSEILRCVNKGIIACYMKLEFHTGFFLNKEIIYLFCGIIVVEEAIKTFDVSNFITIIDLNTHN